MIRSVLVFWLFLLSMLSPCASAELWPCYTHQPPSKDSSSMEHRNFMDLSYLMIIKQDENGISFFHKKAGGNNHQCTIPGYAKKTDDNNYVFIDKEEYWTENGWEAYGYHIAEDDTRCTLTFVFREQEVNVSSDGRCKRFCGARASFGGALKKTDDVSICEKQIFSP